MMKPNSKAFALKAIRINISRFKRNEEGVTAVEFALVAFPFFVFVFAVIELGVSFVAQQMLSSATEDLARKFYTGESTQENTTSDDVRNAICKRIKFLVDDNCLTNLSINLNNYNSFAEVPITNLVTKAGYLGLPATIKLGGPSTINQINVLYRWPAITNIMRMITPGIKPDDNIIPLFTTMTWRNEPYS